MEDMKTTLEDGMTSKGVEGARLIAGKWLMVIRKAFRSYMQCCSFQLTMCACFVLFPPKVGWAIMGLAGILLAEQPTGVVFGLVKRIKKCTKDKARRSMPNDAEANSKKQGLDCLRMIPLLQHQCPLVNLSFL